MGIVVEVLCELENFHMSREELEVTFAFRSLPKTQSDLLAHCCSLIHVI